MSISSTSQTHYVPKCWFLEWDLQQIGTEWRAFIKKDIASIALYINVKYLIGRMLLYVKTISFLIWDYMYWLNSKFLIYLQMKFWTQNESIRILYDSNEYFGILPYTFLTGCMFNFGHQQKFIKPLSDSKIKLGTIRMSYVALSNFKIF